MATDLDYTTAQTFAVGDRVELHPGTDMWMRGARFGTVVGRSLTSQDAIRVELDRIPGRKFCGPVERFRHAR
jgi:hypothetical protein